MVTDMMHLLTSQENQIFVFINESGLASALNLMIFQPVNLCLSNLKYNRDIKVCSCKVLNGTRTEAVPVSTALLAVHPEQVDLNKATSSFPFSSPPAVEAAAAAAAGRTAAAVELAFPSPCLHPPFPTLYQVSLTVALSFSGRTPQATVSLVIRL